MGTGHLDITCIVSVHYTVPLRCWENGVSWWQSLELQEQCHLDPAGIMAIVAMAIVAMDIVAMAIVDLGLPHHGNREVGRLAPYHGLLAHFGPLDLYHGRLGLGHQDLPAMDLAVDPPLGAQDLDMVVDPSPGALDLPAITADKAAAQNEEDNDNAWPYWKRKIAFIV